MPRIESATAMAITHQKLPAMVMPNAQYATAVTTAACTVAARPNASA